MISTTSDSFYLVSCFLTIVVRNIAIEEIVRLMPPKIKVPMYDPVLSFKVAAIIGPHTAPNPIATEISPYTFVKFSRPKFCTYIIVLSEFVKPIHEPKTMQLLNQTIFSYSLYIHKKISSHTQ